MAATRGSGFNRYKTEIASTKWGMLTPIEYVGQDPKSRRTLWLCRCDCGKERVYRSDCLRERRSTSCGCVRSRRHFAPGSATARGNAVRTEFTPFIRLRSMILSRCDANPSKYGSTVASLDDLVRIWSEQRGVCPYTGWKLVLPHNGRGWATQVDRHRHASVDRKNPRLGYTSDNIQFTALIANLAKSDFSDSVFADFCSAVHNFRASSSAVEHAVANGEVVGASPA
jgi:hypothetical protein